MNSSQATTVANKITPVIFTGNTTEYFGIWIVNLLLSILTLGVYSAWAKVRRKKYFYNNTLIDQVGFDYHAKPISILIGRVIAVALLLLAAINPILQSVVFLLIFIILPWLVVRGSIFNARNSSHRGLRFNFVGKLGSAIRVFIGLPLLTMISFGLAAPYAAHEKNQFLVNNHLFGLSRFEMKRVVAGFYKVYIILFIVPLIGVVLALALPAYKAYITKETHQGHVEQIHSFDQVNQKILLNTLHNPAASAEKNASNESKANLFQWVQISNEWVFILLGAGIYLMFIFGFLGYLQARIGNLIWNNTTLEKLSFNSQLRARDFAWIYFSNIVAIMLTMGLATPWAQIRLARYRTSKLNILSDGDFDGFVNDKKTEVKATGEEIAEMFDVDLTFG